VPMRTPWRLRVESERPRIVIAPSSLSVAQSTSRQMPGKS